MLLFLLFGLFLLRAAARRLFWLLLFQEPPRKHRPAGSGWPCWLPKRPAPDSIRSFCKMGHFPTGSDSPPARFRGMASALARPFPLKSQRSEGSEIRVTELDGDRHYNPKPDVVIP